MFGKKDKKKKNDNPKALNMKELIKTETQPVFVWALYDNKEPSKPLTFATSYNQIYAALDQLLYVKHYSHFRQWCSLRDIPVNHRESWARYSKEVISNGFDLDGGAVYTIARVDYEPEVIAAMLRSINQCEPFGNPFETKEETERIAERLTSTPEEELTPVEKGLMLLFDDIDADKVEESAEIKAHCDIPLTDNKGDKKYDA